MERTLVLPAFRRFKPLALLGRMAATTRQRRALGRLDARLLDDVGINSDAARTEAKRPVWDVPKTWLR